MFREFSVAMKSEFEMTDIGLMNYFLGIKVTQNSDGTFISQEKYANDIFKRFKMQNNKEKITPIAMGVKLSKEDENIKVESTLYKSLVGSLMYLTTTRPDIMYAISLISRFMEDPHDAHLQAGKRILRYVKGTTNHGIFYEKNDALKLFGYIDSDWEGNKDDRKSTLGYAFIFCSGAISWSSKK
eukprot:Gb_02109 [translate_table: standard]